MLNGGLRFSRKRKRVGVLGVDFERLKRVRKPFEKITYTEAVGLLADYGVKWGDDLKSVHEKALVQMMGNQPLFVTHFPKAIKFFNMRENDENPAIVNSADLLLPMSGEAVGAAEREYRYEKALREACKLNNV
jgi:asparaginyl-tRNA synthetase